MRILQTTLKLGLLSGMVGALSYVAFMQFLIKLIFAIADHSGGGFSGGLNALLIVGALLLGIYLAFIAASALAIWKLSLKFHLMDEQDVKVVILASIIIAGTGIKAVSHDFDPNAISVAAYFSFVYCGVYLLTHIQSSKPQ